MVILSQLRKVGVMMKNITTIQYHKNLGELMGD